MLDKAPVRILVIENDQRWEYTIKRQIDFVLDAIGCTGEIKFATEAAVASKLLDDERPWHLAVTDMDADRASFKPSLEFVMNARDYKVPCIAISAMLTGAQVYTLIRQYGARAYFDKPFDLDDFKTEVRTILKPPPSDLMLVKPIFNGRAFSRRDNGVLILMPFTQSWSEWLYRDLVTPICIDIGLVPYRADDLFGHDVMEDIWLAILESELIIADLTGRNANVLYELGIVHTVGKPFVLLTQRKKDIPFDLIRYRHVIYKNPKVYAQYPDKLKMLKEELKLKLKEVPRT